MDKMEIIDPKIFDWQPIDAKKEYPFTEALRKYKMKASSFKVLFDDSLMVKASNDTISCEFKYKDNEMNIWSCNDSIVLCSKNHILFIIEHGMEAFRKANIDNVIKMICDMGFIQDDDHYVKDKVTFHIRDRGHYVCYSLMITGYEEKCYYEFHLKSLKSTINNIIMLSQRMNESNSSIKGTFPNSRFHDKSDDHQIDCEISYSSKNYHIYRVSFFKSFHEDKVKVTFNQSLGDSCYEYKSIEESKEGSYDEMVSLVTLCVKKFCDLYNISI